MCVCVCLCLCVCVSVGVCVCVSTPQSLINPSERLKANVNEDVAIREWPNWTDDNRSFGLSSDVL